MRSYSPNLKPHQLHNHSDAAERLGVPHTNILDLRQKTESAEPTEVPMAETVRVAAEPKKMGWWQRRRMRRARTPVSPIPVSAVELAPVEPAAPIAATIPAQSFDRIQWSDDRALREPTPVPEAAQLKPASAQPSRRTPRVSRHWQWRPAMTFAIVSLCCVAPFGAFALFQHVNVTRHHIETISQEATQHLNQAADYSTNLNFPRAVQAFDSAATNFRTARGQLTSINAGLTPLLRLLPEHGNQFSSAENILMAGEQLAAAGADITTAFSILDQTAAEQIVAPTSTELLVTIHSAFRPAIPRLERAAIALAAIDLATVPEEYRSAIAQAQTTVPTIARSLTDLLSLSETLLVILGHEEPKRYLVLFQNNRELRATGGFIGSFAMVDIYQGKVRAIEIPGGGPYDLLGNLKVKVISPQPLHLVNPHWQMQDANWWPDFPTSAQKIQWFYRKSGGSTVDGVITLTPDVIEQMLDITGPIGMPEYAMTVTADNFYRVTQIQAERKYDETRESKKFISDLTPKLLDRLFTLDTDTFLPVLQVVYTGLVEKDILLYFNDPFLQNELVSRGWTGEIKQTSRDYLMVVDTNIAGGKTDAAITETIEHQAEIQLDGTVIDTVTITRTHQGKSDDVFEDANNMDYVRIYVPAGSQLLSAEGFTQPEPDLFLDVGQGYVPDEDLSTISGDVIIDEQTQTRINQEFGKTVFGNWLETRPGETSRATVRYQLPFRVQPGGVFEPTDYYSLLVQKQPGSFDPLLMTAVSYPKNYRVNWSYPNPAATLHQTLSSDVFAGIVLEQ